MVSGSCDYIPGQYRRRSLETGSVLARPPVRSWAHKLLLPFPLRSRWLVVLGFPVQPLPGQLVVPGLPGQPLLRKLVVLGFPVQPLPAQRR